MLRHSPVLKIRSCDQTRYKVKQTPDIDVQLCVVARNVSKRPESDTFVPNDHEERLNAANFAAVHELFDSGGYIPTIDIRCPSDPPGSRWPRVRYEAGTERKMSSGDQEWEFGALFGV